MRKLDCGFTSSPSLYQSPSQSSLFTLHSSSAASPMMALQSESPAWKWTPGSEDSSTTKLSNVRGQQLISACVLYKVFVTHPCMDVYTLTSKSSSFFICAFLVDIMYFIVVFNIKYMLKCRYARKYLNWTDNIYQVSTGCKRSVFGCFFFISCWRCLLG